MREFLALASALSGVVVVCVTLTTGAEYQTSQQRRCTEATVLYGCVLCVMLALIAYLL